MVLSLALIVAVGMECEAPPWRIDQISVMRDSADIIVEGFVTSVRLLSPPEVTEEQYRWMPYEATLLVERAWLGVVDSVITVRVENIECDPNPSFLRHEVLGLKAREYGWWAFSTLDPGYLPIDTAEAATFFAGLGPGNPPSGPTRGPRWLLALGAAAVLAGGLALARRLNGLPKCFDGGRANKRSPLTR